MENNNMITPDNGKTASIISYFTIIGWLIAYFAMHKDNKTALGSYQLRQTLLFSIITIAVGWIFNFILGILIITTGIFSLIYIINIIYIALFIVWIIGLIGAINGEQKPMPFIGEKAQSIFPAI